MSSALVVTRRTHGQLRTTLARIAQAASQIHALYERYGPDEPWRFADPSGWKCSPRYCAHHARCPGGGGLWATAGARELKRGSRPGRWQRRRPWRTQPLTRRHAPT